MIQSITSFFFDKHCFQHRPFKVRDRVLTLLSEGKIDAMIAKQLLGCEDGAAAPSTKKRPCDEMTNDDADSNDEFPEDELDALLSNANTNKKDTCLTHVKKYFGNT